MATTTATAAVNASLLRPTLTRLTFLTGRRSFERVDIKIVYLSQTTKIKTVCFRLCLSANRNIKAAHKSARDLKTVINVTYVCNKNIETLNLTQRGI